MNTDNKMQSTEACEMSRYTAGVGWRGGGYSHNRNIRIKNEVLRGLFALPCEQAPLFDPKKMGRCLPPREENKKKGEVNGIKE
jgi:hypothetical protein